MFKLNNKRVIPISKLCRTCLTERGHLRDIFSTKIPNMLESITSVEIAESDGLPPKICVTCFHLIAKFYTYKKKVEKNDQFLRNRIKVMEKDILGIAVSDAQIMSDTSLDRDSSKFLHTGAGTDTDVEQNQPEPLPESTEDCSRKESYLIDKSFSVIELSTQDKNSDKDDLSEKQLIESGAGDDDGNGCDDEVQYPALEVIEEIVETTDHSIPNTITSHLFSSDPPPLIPLDTETSKPEPETKQIKTTTTTPSLVDTPPLIPLPFVVKTDFAKKSIDSEELLLNCPTCNKEFLSIETLKHHKLFDCFNTNLQCSICKKEFRERKKLIGHLKGHMTVKGYVCKICGKKYPNPSTFKVHMRTHTGERPFKCEICGKGFVRWAGVQGHLRTHQSNKPFLCSTCGKSFKIASNLERHKVLHSGSLPFCCNYCGKTFSQADNLRLHIRTYHTNERPYLCNECGKGFVSSTRLTRHMWVHTGFKPYKCKVCSKAYSNSNDLKIHQRSHSGTRNEDDKPYACEVCEMRFYHPCRVNKHMKTHDRPHACITCHKTFSTVYLLRKHVRNKHNAAESQVQCVEEVVGDDEQNESKIFIGDDEQNESKIFL